MTSGSTQESRNSMIGLISSGTICVKVTPASSRRSTILSSAVTRLVT